MQGGLVPRLGLSRRRRLGDEVTPERTCRRIGRDQVVRLLPDRRRHGPFLELLASDQPLESVPAVADGGRIRQTHAPSEVGRTVGRSGKGGSGDACQATIGWLVETR